MDFLYIADAVSWWVVHPLNRAKVQAVTMREENFMGRLISFY